MTDDPPRLDRPAEWRRPHVVPEGGRAQPAQPAGAAEAGFAARVGADLGDGPSPSMLRYPGPRGHRGFEAHAPAPSDPTPAVGLWEPPGSSSSDGGWDTIDWGHAARRPPDDGRATGSPDDGRPDRAAADPQARLDGPARPPSQAIPRRRPPALPGYEILEELGRGGMGVVYKARQLRLNRLVALKMILAGDHAGSDAVGRFLAEARIVARLGHPNIVRIHAIGDSDGRPYVELEYVEGGSLAARLDGTPWPPRAAACLVESLASALAEAHRAGIVHRDLKPANILMTDDGTPKITDFGLAKSSDTDLGLTRTDSILGSPSYMAPEQAEGRSREVGPAADIHALGANLYELLTGRPPFVGPTILSTLALVKNAEPVAPRQWQPGVPPDLQTICLKCLRKEPGRRYESAAALAEDLRRFLDGEPILARPTPRWERAWKWLRRRPAFAALIVVTALSIMAAAAGGHWYRSELDRQRAAVRRRVEDVRTRTMRHLVLGADAMQRGDWDGALRQMSGAQALGRTEPDLAAIVRDASCALDRIEMRIAARDRRAAARARLAVFDRCYDEALFHRWQHTGLDAEASQRASRAAARQALARFEPASGPARGLDLEHGAFDPDEARALAERYYELSLILAEAIARPMEGEDAAAQAREALTVLDRAESAFPPTRVYFLRRAGYLTRAGDRAAADAARARAASAGAGEGSAVDDFVEGEAAYRAHDYARATAALRRVLARQPARFWGQYLIALCHLKAHRPAAAQAALTVCQAARPGFVWTDLLKGFAEGEMGEFDLAEADFERAIGRGLDDDARYAMLVNRGVMRVRRGRSASAAEDFHSAIALRPGQFAAYINLSQAYHDLGRSDEALGVLDRAIARFPVQPALHRARAQAYRLRSHDAEALEDLARAIAAAPPDDPARAGDHLDRAAILLRADRPAEALAECDRAAAIAPDGPDAYRLRGAALARLGQFDEAARSFDLCLARGVPSPALYEARGLAMAHRGSYDRAIADYTLAMEAGRPTASLHVHRGWAYLFGGAPAPAAADFDEALRLSPSDARALGGRALAYVNLRRTREAVADARASIASAAADARLIYNAARVYCQAATALESGPARSHADREAAGRLRADALNLLERALGRMSAPERSGFWGQVVRGDAALEPIRRSRAFLDLDARLGRPARGGATAGATSQ